MTTDFLEDAADVLDKCESPYIIFLGDGDMMRISTNVGEECIPVFEEWLAEGYLDSLLRDMIQSLRQQ